MTIKKWLKGKAKLNNQKKKTLINKYQVVKSIILTKTIILLLLTAKRKKKRKRKKNSHITSNWSTQIRQKLIPKPPQAAFSLLTAGGRPFHRIAPRTKNEDARAEVRWLGLIRKSRRPTKLQSIKQLWYDERYH
jgi:hypothetical protein